MFLTNFHTTKKMRGATYYEAKILADDKWVRRRDADIPRAIQRKMSSDSRRGVPAALQSKICSATQEAMFQRPHPIDDCAAIPADALPRK